MGREPVEASSDAGALDLSVVIPVYNEETILRESVEEMCARLEPSGVGFEVILAENGSRDRTVQIAEELAAERAERVRTLVNPDAEIVHIPYEEAYGAGYEDLRARVPDVSKAERAIGFETTMNLDAIISEVLEYFRQKRNQG